MLVTINTDASFYKRQQRGSYAFWAVSNKFKIIKYDILKGPCQRPDEAEMKCIINALYMVLPAEDSVRRLIVNTDSMNAIHVFEHDKEAIKRWGLHWAAGLRNRYNKIVGAYPDVAIEFRHVKAHAGTESPRAWVNDWCDRMAKKVLYEKINQ